MYMYTYNVNEKPPVKTKDRCHLLHKIETDFNNSISENDFGKFAYIGLLVYI